MARVLKIGPGVRVRGISTVQGCMKVSASSTVNRYSSVSASSRRKRSVRIMFGPAPQKEFFSEKFVVSTTSVSPSQWPRERLPSIDEWFAEDESCRRAGRSESRDPSRCGWRRIREAQASRVAEPRRRPPASSASMNNAISLRCMCRAHDLGWITPFGCVAGTGMRHRRSSQFAASRFVSEFAALEIDSKLYPRCPTLPVQFWRDRMPTPL